MSIVTEILADLNISEEETGTSEEKNNKATCIREAISALGEDAKTNAIIAWVKDNKGIDVTYSYVTGIKNQSKSRLKFSASSWLLAKSLIKDVGGISQAKAILSCLEAEQDNINVMRENHLAILVDLERMLAEGSATMKPRKKKTLIRECMQLRRLLKSINQTERLHGSYSV
jgi:hypothetical protein